MSGGKSHSELHAADATSIEHRDRAASDALAMGPQHAIEALQQSAGNRAVGGLLNEATQTSPRMGTGGTLLDAGVRQDMEARFAEPFQDVRVHADRAAAQEAAALGAKAYTQGREVFFGAGRYAPHTREGRHLLAHELAHVVQQARGGSDIPAGAEADADRVAATVATGGTARVGTAAAPGVQCAPEGTPWWKRVQKGAGAVVDRVAQAPAALKEAAVETKDRAVQKYDETKATVTQNLEKVTTKDVKAAALNTTKRMLKPTQMLADVSGTARKKMAGAMTRAKGGKDEGRVTALNNMVVATDNFVQAWNRSQTEPTKVFVQTLKEKKGFVAAVKAAQQSSDETLEGMADSFKQAVNDYEDGKFMPPAPKLIAPAKHPTLSAVEDKVGGAMGSVHGFQRQVQGGVMKALWSMGTGISQIGVHPVNTLRGLGEMPAAGPLRPVGQTVGLIDDLIVPPEGMTRKQVLDAHGEKQKFNPKRDFEQTKKLAMGFGENYIEALGGKVEKNKQTGDMKIVRGDKERVGEIPGLLLVDVGSFFIPGGGATKGTKGLATAAKGGELARTVGTVGELSKTADVVGGVGKTAEATSGLAKTAEATSSFAKTAEGGAGVVKVADAGGAVKAADTSGVAKGLGEAGDLGKAAPVGAEAKGMGTAGEAPGLFKDLEGKFKEIFGPEPPKPANDNLPVELPKAPEPTPIPKAPEPPAQVFDVPKDMPRPAEPYKFKPGYEPVSDIGKAKPKPPEPPTAAPQVQEVPQAEALADVAAKESQVPLKKVSGMRDPVPAGDLAESPVAMAKPKGPGRGGPRPAPLKAVPPPGTAAPKGARTPAGGPTPKEVPPKADQIPKPKAAEARKPEAAKKPRTPEEEFADFEKWRTEELGATGPLTSDKLLQMYRHGSRATVAKYLKQYLMKQAAANGVMTIGEMSMKVKQGASLEKQVDAFVKRLEGAHSTPQAFGKKLPKDAQDVLPGGKYNPDDALVTLTDKPMHTAMDQPWKDAFNNWRKAGAKEATAQEVFDAVADGIRKTPGMSDSEKASRIARLHDEMFAELGLVPGRKYDIPRIYNWWEILAFKAKGK